MLLVTALQTEYTTPFKIYKIKIFIIIIFIVIYITCIKLASNEVKSIPLLFIFLVSIAVLVTVLVPAKIGNIENKNVMWILNTKSSILNDLLYFAL